MLAVDLLHLNLAAIITVSRSIFAQSGLIAEEKETAVVVVLARMIGTLSLCSILVVGSHVNAFLHVL